ncbi:putative pyridoxamine 5'-phosphate oxidase family protein [Methanomicrobium sp. W14]|uniref:pyridoxamine 5'-phosphate oxidase family protein n=1 Tax=Methanomicrobium sp. W14 TaxID=2817839 RepID=UPI001AE5FA1C|nr:pyridoxamine 5'-phosphate oxidase family protein [Methanomicrobium sp. W14]MBP2134194.1 putative pyridoxamine 5'-phosphate oxidase family protein [Methanomicrobium sp. W14]
MDLEECIKFANENPVAWVGTEDGDQPRVRPLGMWFADKTGFYFQIWTIKDIYKQMEKNPVLELGFISEKKDRVLRIAGRAEFLDDLKLKEKSLNDRPFLKDFGLTADSPKLAIFRISKGEAYFWTMETNLDPKKKLLF